MNLPRFLKAGLMAAAASLVLSGCLVSATPASRGVAYGEAGLYYEGHVVYHDRVGEPYVLVGRTTRYVPRSHPRYVELRRAPPRHARQHRRYERRNEHGYQRGRDHDRRYERHPARRYERW